MSVLVCVTRNYGEVVVRDTYNWVVAKFTNPTTNQVALVRGCVFDFNDAHAISSYVRLAGSLEGQSTTILSNAMVNVWRDKILGILPGTGVQGSSFTYDWKP